MKEEFKNQFVKRTQKDYNLAFKLSVVKEFEDNQVTLASLQRKYGIQGSHTLKRWIEKYGNFDHTYQLPNKMNTPKDQEIFELKEQVKLLERQKKRLEKEVEQSDKKAILFDMMIDIAEDEFNIPIRKKSLPESLIATKKNKEHQ